MKKCRRCSKPATLHITEVRDGKAAALHLCEICARDYLEESESSAAPSSTADLASKLEDLASDASEEMLAMLKCPSCGITFSEFRENGRFGCAQDYTEFMSELLPLIENIHEDTTHRGKRPRTGSAGTEEQSRLIQLRSEQKEAIDREDYEVAARLRDEIAELEASMRPGNTPAADE
jgi:protein arginine kinase activator